MDPQYQGRIRPDESAKTHPDLTRALLLAAADD
jgi:hypothetical protein